MKSTTKVSGFRLSIFALGIAVLCLTLLLVSRLVLPSGAYLEDKVTTQITITNTTNAADNSGTSSSEDETSSQSSTAE